MLYFFIIAKFYEKEAKGMKWLKTSILALFLSFVFSIGNNTAEAITSSECNQSSVVKKSYINVPVATLWKEPGSKRSIDQSVLSIPVDMRKWTSSMSNVQKRIWLTGKTESQALYGQEVQILGTKGEWVQIAIKDQATVKNKYGYLGWLPKEQIHTGLLKYEKCPVAIVKARTTHLYDDKQKKDLEISFNTKLPVISEEQNWVQVNTPTNQVKWVKKTDVNIYTSKAEFPKPTGTDLVMTAKQFLGLSYLWSGTSAYGFDCSGFTFSIYKSYGMHLPRDASEQYKRGKPVLKTNLQPGDLLFFATNHGKGKVHHVAMYIGNGKMIHSPEAGKQVEIIPIDTPSYKKEFAGARRYI